MAREVLHSAGLTKRDIINSKNGISLKDCTGTEINLLACGTIEITDEETGEIKTAAVMRTDSGEIITSISAGVIELMSDVADVISDEGSAKIIARMRTAKSGREFLALTIL